MGVKNLYKLIKEFAPGAITTTTVRDLDGLRIAIDASMVIYQWCSVGSMRKIVNREGKFINHIQGAFFRTLNMILAGIIPVYVFDGMPPKAKVETITERRAARDAGTAVRVPREVFTEVSKLLSLMGVQTIQAPSEAEAQAVFFTINGVLDAVATEDMDVVAFGAKFMIRGLDTAAKNIVVIETAKVLSELGITREQFVDLCILLGSDYTTETLPGIGYKTAIRELCQHGTIEKLLEAKSITSPAGFTYREARAEFLTPVVAQIKLDPEVKKLTRDDIRKLREFLVDIHGLEATRVEKSLVKLSKYHGIG